MNTVIAGDASGVAEIERLRADARRNAAARRRGRRLAVWTIRLASLVALLALWQWVGARTNPVLFTTPTAILAAAIDMIGSGELWSYLAPSLVVLGVGLVIAAVAGIGLGLLLARFWVLDTGLEMYITFLYATPAVALVPLIVLWTGFQLTAKLIILVLFAIFPLIINTYQGVKNVDPKLLEVGRAFRCSEGAMWRHIILPAVVPFIVTGLRLAVGRGLIGMVMADLYTAISGIGYLILRSAGTYRVDKMFVPVVTLGMLGIALTALLRMAEAAVAPWTSRKGE